MDEQGEREYREGDVEKTKRKRRRERKERRRTNSKKGRRTEQAKGDSDHLRCLHHHLVPLARAPHIVRGHKDNNSGSVALALPLSLSLAQCSTRSRLPLRMTIECLGGLPWFLLTECFGHSPVIERTPCRRPFRKPVSRLLVFACSPLFADPLGCLPHFFFPQSHSLDGWGQTGSQVQPMRSLLPPPPLFQRGSTASHLLLIAFTCSCGCLVQCKTTPLPELSFCVPLLVRPLWPSRYHRSCNKHARVSYLSDFAIICPDNTSFSFSLSTRGGVREETLSSPSGIYFPCNTQSIVRCSVRFV